MKKLFPNPLCDARFYRSFVLLWILNTLLITASHLSTLHYQIDGYFVVSFLYRELMFFVSYLALFALIFWLRLRLLQNLLLFVVVGLSIACFMVELFCFYNFSTLLNSYVVTIALESNMRESVEFLSSYVDLWLLGGYGLLFLGVLLCFKLKAPVRLPRLKWIFGMGLLIVVIVHVTSMRPSSPVLRYSDVLYHTHDSVTRAINRAIAFMEEYKRLQAKLDEMAASLEVVPSREKIANFVLVIGESTQRGKMSLYGYPLPTTPLLEELKKSQPDNLFVFSDVISSQGSTYESLSQALTFSNQENAQTPWYEHFNMIDALKLGGYRTYVFSNQEAVSFFGNGVATIFNRADRAKFLNYSDSFDLTRLDEELLDAYDEFVGQTLSSPPPQLNPLSSESVSENLAFFVFHLMGSHDGYGMRYPGEFEIFKADDIAQELGKKSKIAAYLNSVRYGDYVLREIIKRFEDSDSLVLYFSDHGEEVYEERNFAGHGNPKLSRYIVEVPYIIYVSEGFKAKHKELYERIKAAQNQRYMNDDLLHTLLDIAGIEMRGYEKRRSILSNDEFLRTRARIVGDGEFKKDYDRELVGQ